MLLAGLNTLQSRRLHSTVALPRFFGWFLFSMVKRNWKRGAGEEFVVTFFVVVLVAFAFLKAFSGGGGALMGCKLKELSRKVLWAVRAERALAPNVVSDH